MTGFFKTLSVHRLYCIQSLFFFAPMTFGHSAATADAVKMSWKYAAAAKQQQKLRWTLDQKQRSIFCLHLIRITHFTHKNTHERCASTFLPFPAAAATEKRDWKVRTVRFLLNTCLMFMAYKIQSDEICVHVCVWVGGWRVGVCDVRWFWIIHNEHSPASVRHVNIRRLLLLSIKHWTYANILKFYTIPTNPNEEEPEEEKRVNLRKMTCTSCRRQH